LTVTARCPACGEQAAAGQRFCGACGAEFMRTCESCGAQNPPGFRFCGGCGAALGAEASRTPASVGEHGEERRWATVLFADLSGFTSFAEQKDPEEVRQLADRCMRTMGAVVEQFGGSVDKVIGDALMAVFGAPVAHEDDPARAVRAGLEIQRRASQSVEDFSGLCVRVGVNTGEVIFARVGPDGRRELTVMGDAVNTAARLQAAAPPDGVLVGEATHAATAEDITYEALPPFQAKGKAAQLQPWLARSATPAPAERPVSSTPFVGREADLDMLMSTWRRTAAELAPRLVTVVGPPGIGKTRLAREFAERLEAHGARVLRGRALPYGERAAYDAFAQILKEASGIFATDAASVAGEKLARRLKALLPAEEVGASATHLSILARLTEETVEDREPLFGAAQRFLEALGRERPALIVLEDLHWADQGLLELIASLVVRLSDAPVLVLALARPEFLDAQPDWARLPTNVTMQLDALGELHTRDLVGRLLPPDVDIESTIAQIEQTVGGNPLWIEELVAWLAESRGSEPDRLPTNLKTMIAARLDRLPEAERQLVLNAAVIGDVFWQGALEALGTAGPLAELLPSLERRDLLRRRPWSRIEGDQELSFKHSLVREVAYSTLSRAARAQRHGAVAEFIERRAGDRTAYATALAHHWRHAGAAEKAVDYLLTAAAQAGRGWAQHEALDLCNQALELVPEDNEKLRRRVRLRRGVAVSSQMHAAHDVTLRRQSKSSGETSPPIS